MGASVSPCLASPVFHDLGAVRSKQLVGVCCLGCPVTDRVHVHVQVRESGGSSPGSRGSRLSRRALVGIALRLSTFLSRRHL